MNQPPDLHPLTTLPNDRVSRRLVRGSVTAQIPQLVHPSPRILKWVLASAMLLMFASFTAPEELETLTHWFTRGRGLARLLALSCCGYAIAMLWGCSARRAIVGAFVPFALFLVFAVSSVSWSALPIRSIWHAGGLVVLASLALAVALLRATWGPAVQSKVLCALASGTLGMSAVILSLNRVFPEWCSLDRVSSGFAHPTWATGCASLGVLILVVSRFLWGYRWSRRLILPGLFLHGALIVIAANRLGTALSLVLLCAAVIFSGRRAWISTLVATACAAGVIYLVVDPRLDQLGSTVDSVSVHARRDQGDEAISSLSGRAEMWGAVWDSFLQAPLLGHGSFVTSSTGELFVWYEWGNWTAHNAVLQLLATSGVVGAVLFFWGVLRPARIAARGVARGDPLKVLLALIAVWFVCWGTLNSSILGATKPDSIVFFALLGLAVGSVHRPLPVSEEWQ